MVVVLVVVVSNGAMREMSLALAVAVVVVSRGSMDSISSSRVRAASSLLRIWNSSRMRRAAHSPAGKDLRRWVVARYSW